MPLKGEFMSPPENYRFIRVENFDRNLRDFRKRDQERILDKVYEMLSFNPKRYGMMKGKISIRGVKLTGLRHMKIGIKGVKGGAYILYRICQECKENKYIESSDRKCNFCDEDPNDNRIILFDIHLRSFDYGR